MIITYDNIYLAMFINIWFNAKNKHFRIKAECQKYEKFYFKLLARKQRYQEFEI